MTNAGFSAKQIAKLDKEMENLSYKNVRDKAGLDWYTNKSEYPGADTWNDVAEAVRQFNPFRKWTG